MEGSMYTEEVLNKEAKPIGPTRHREMPRSVILLEQAKKKMADFIALPEEVQKWQQAFLGGSKLHKALKSGESMQVKRSEANGPMLYEGIKNLVMSSRYANLKEGERLGKMAELCYDATCRCNDFWRTHALIAKRVGEDIEYCLVLDPKGGGWEPLGSEGQIFWNGRYWKFMDGRYVLADGWNLQTQQLHFPDAPETVVVTNATVTAGDYQQYQEQFLTTAGCEDLCPGDRDKAVRIFCNIRDILNDLHAIFYPHANTASALADKERMKRDLLSVREFARGRCDDETVKEVNILLLWGHCHDSRVHNSLLTRLGYERNTQISPFRAVYAISKVKEFLDLDLNTDPRTSQASSHRVWTFLRQRWTRQT
jgi:hypothetical protein